MNKSEHEALLMRVRACRNELMRKSDVIEFIFPDISVNVDASSIRHLILDKLDRCPTVEAVSRDEFDALLKRFRHLLESDYIRSFDEVDPKMGTYKRDILEAIDVEPIKTARWAHLGGDEWYCTRCGEVITTEGSWEKPTDKYCHECGAKMKLEVDEK